MLKHVTEMEKYILAYIEEQIYDGDAWEVYNYQGVVSDKNIKYWKALDGLKTLCTALYESLRNDNLDFIMDCLDEVESDISECNCYSQYKSDIISRLCNIQNTLLYSNCDEDTIEELIDSIEVLANYVKGIQSDNPSEKEKKLSDLIAELTVEPEPEQEEFNGVVYPSMDALAKAYGISVSTYQSRLFSGWTKEEALGVVLKIVGVPYLSDKTFDIDNMQPGVRHIFNENVYCVLGISASSLRADVLACRDKLEKYHKIGAIATYNSRYDLVGVQKPNRDLGHLQIVLSKLGRLEDRWLWFKQDKYNKFWNAKIVDHMRSDDSDYDELLAAYFSVLISDPFFNKVGKWNRVLTVIDRWLQRQEQDLYKIISGHVSSEDKNKYNYKMIVSSFRNTILLPLQNNILEGDSNYVAAAFPFWKENCVSFAKNFEKQCADRAIEMANDQLTTIIFTVNSIPDNNHPSESAARNMISVTEAFLDNDYAGLVYLADVLSGYELYSDIIKEKIRKNLWDAGYIVWKSGNNKSAARIFSSIYSFCDDEKKKQIKNTFELEQLTEMSEDDFTDEEIIKIADAHDENGDYELAIRWYRVGVRRNEAHAEYKLGEYYEMGLAVKVSLKTAYSWYIKAAEHGDISARRRMARVYYDGSKYCAKNIYLAKMYWISVYIEHPREANARYLNRYFPKWKTEENEAYYVLKNKRKSEIEDLAKKGIAAAAYWLGENLYSPDWFWGRLNGFTEDKNAARRWFLKAALFDYSPAYEKLYEYFNIDAKEAYSSSAMFQCGVNYSKDKSEQGKDLTFYWYRKAVDSGYEDGCNNLGVCYDDATGTEQDYETANALYLRAIKHNGNSGAYHNYGVNLFYGSGVKQDKEKAKEYLLKARDKGSESAKRFLKEHYGITDGLSIEFDAIKDTVIFDNDGLYIEFCGLKTTEDGFELRFWINNKSGTQYNIWAKSVNVNDDEVKSFSSVGKYEDGDCHFANVEFEKPLKAGDVIDLAVEIDNVDDEEICTTNNFKIIIDSITSKPTLKIIGVLISPSLKSEEVDDGDSYAFALDDFDDVTIYNKNGVRIDFCGFEVDEDDESVSMSFWVKNTSSATRKIWVMETAVDGDDADIMEMIGEYKPGAKGYTSIAIPQMDVYDEYFIEMTLEVDDDDNKALDEVGKLNISIDFNAEEIDVEVKDDNMTDSNSQSTNTIDALYSPGSYYILNDEHNGIEIYFPSKPKESIRDALKAGRWRWFQKKGCWYTFNSATNKNLADRITGNNMRR